ncbi:hypothetical protein [Agaribacterium sp. ZY112]|uniref:hypothetical protein n=1 Tax=Agaribacterium sp. ZY112 TaxID=3233574 RepID=UPI003524636E
MKQIAILLIRLLSIYLIYQAITSVTSILAIPQSWGSKTELLLPALAWIVIPLLAGVLLWWLSPKLANSALSQTDETRNITEDGVVRSGTFLIGLFILIKSISLLVGRWSAQSVVDYGSLVAVILSLLLLCGSGVIAKAYKVMRTWGQNA